MERAWLVGEKIYLRAIEKSDIDDGWHDWINDPINTVGLWTPNPQGHHHMVDYFDSQQDHSRTVMFAICERETGRYIGNARLFDINWIHRICGYGRLIGPRDARGKGLGSDALIQLLRHGFHGLGMNRIWSAAWVQNAQSLSSNDKVGMTREGIAKEFVFKNGEFHDAVYLRMLRSEFDELHGGPDYWAERDAKLRADARSASTRG